ncbi:MAG: hypothetical protein SVO01_00615 [Thermotogota bacterium]|nr:hypothetical protein [Thermotogota bacterium]
MIKLILTISLLANIILAIHICMRLQKTPSPTDWDIINQKAAIKFYYDAYHKNIPPGFINATRMNNFRFWLNEECIIDLTSLPPKYLAWCNKLKSNQK